MRVAITKALIRSTSNWTDWIFPSNHTFLGSDVQLSEQRPSNTTCFQPPPVSLCVSVFSILVAFTFFQPAPVEDVTQCELSLSFSHEIHSFFSQLQSHGQSIDLFSLFFFFVER